MADTRTSFITLEDVSTQAGVPLHRALENDAAAGKNAHPALVYKDPSGNLRYGKVNATGEVVVSLETAEVANLSDEGGVSGTTSFQTIASITLQNDYVYKKIGFMGSCFRDAIFELVQIDDSAGTPVETVHQTFRVGAGLYNFAREIDNLEFTAGSTGVCVLRLRAKQLQNVPSDIDGSVNATEIQP